MLLAYGRANCEARRIYQVRYPDRRIPHYETFSPTYRRLRGTGNLRHQEPRVSAVQHSVAVDEMILQAFDEELTTSIRIVAATLLNMESLGGCSGRWEACISLHPCSR
ncbi:hypothetical protein B5X24_HaOG208930 [Helicoverpa armigera]|uniref:DUF4817 domain-containing protein n=1 Tax=Helicoverpa armigera TaxID=29058 RepID=A0A2W1BLL2_HELAM|nr:hypothetical protein B5X24_HaOG208930 [Helicoverpa armigera]